MFAEFSSIPSFTRHFNQICAKKSMLNDNPSTIIAAHGTMSFTLKRCRAPVAVGNNGCTNAVTNPLQQQKPLSSPPPLLLLQHHPLFSDRCVPPVDTVRSNRLASRRKVARSMDCWKPMSPITGVVALGSFTWEDAELPLAVVGSLPEKRPRTPVSRDAPFRSGRKTFLQQGTGKYN